MYILLQSDIMNLTHSTIKEHLSILREIYPNAIDDLMNYAIIGYNVQSMSLQCIHNSNLFLGHTDAIEANHIFAPTSLFTDYAENDKNQLEYCISTSKR